ncbi:hypothetical protein VP01_88g5 [Puccinia sorghi]|uniref:Uncharacterized protein n=1 Tax=Puccinia sorghi TaxID=27349 RepID=A0A0L6U842_9BASI|nr:hypothetical protein VP01_88g5 [Puccinia sorghi]
MVDRAPQMDGFRQAMLKTALEKIPQLTEENYPIWKDKMEALLELRGLLTTLNSPARALFTDDNAELKILLMSKMDSVTHKNVVTLENRDSAKALWNSIKEQFASLQYSNRARVFNNFLYLVFQEDSIKQFVMEKTVAIKKLVDVGIDLPQDILAYLMLFKFPATLHSLKRKVMHSDKDLTVQFQKHDQKDRTKITTLTPAGIFTQIKPQIDGRRNKPNGRPARDNKSRIILDSGASAHIFNDKQFFSQITKGEFEEIKTGKENATLPIKGTGPVRLKWGNRVIQLEDCLYVPDIVINLVSAGVLDRKGCQIQSDPGNFYGKKNGNVSLKGKVTGNLFTVDNPTNIGPINKEAHYLPKGYKKKTFMNHTVTRQFNDLPDFSQGQKAMERIHLDLIGPIKPQALGQSKYILSVTDNATGYLAGFPLRIKTRELVTSQVKSAQMVLISKPYHPEHNDHEKSSQVKALLLTQKMFKPLIIEDDKDSTAKETENQTPWTQIRNQEGNNSSNSKSESKIDQSNSSNEAETQIPENQETTPEPTQPPITRTLRDRSTLRPPVQYGFHHYYEPKTFEGSMRCEEVIKWLEAIGKEINLIESHMVWYDHWEKPENPLNTTLTFEIKDNCHIDPLKFNARLCVQGFNQMEGTDHRETFEPTGKSSNLRMILLYALHKNLEILQFGVQGAFLHTPLEEEVYIQTPKGCPLISDYSNLCTA